MIETPKTFPKETPVSFPFKAGRGNSAVKIYKTTSRGYDEFKIPYQDNGVRKFHRFASYEAARVRGNEMLGELTTGAADAITLTNQARASYVSAMDALKVCGVPLELAAIQFADMKLILGDVSPIEAARYFVTHKASALPDKAVADAVTEFISAKEKAGRSGRHLEDLKYRLGKFKASFNCNLGDIGEMTLRKFLDTLNLSARSQNNFRSTLVSFFRWCKKKKYLRREWDELASIETVEDSEGAIEIFTPEDLAAILTHADEQLVPFLVIGAFAGLRSSEICRLDWKQIGVGGGKYIEVKAEDAKKTKQRRLVPMSENLKAWLQPYTKAKGQLWPHKHTYLYELLQPVTVRAKVEWKANALRHSYISYRMAEAQDAAKVSLEAGNSPQMIFSNYRELVTPQEATRWFSIKPDESAEGKITWLKVA